MGSIHFNDNMMLVKKHWENVFRNTHLCYLNNKNFAYIPWKITPAIMEKEIILYKSPIKEMKKKQKYFPRSKKIHWIIIFKLKDLMSLRCAMCAPMRSDISKSTCSVCWLILLVACVLFLLLIIVEWKWEIMLYM